MNKLLIMGGSAPHTALSVPVSYHAGTFTSSPSASSSSASSDDEAAPEDAYDHLNFFLRNGKIVAIEPTGQQPGAQQQKSAPKTIQHTTTLDAEGCVILPGFIDVHVHGGMGYDTMDATPDAIRHLAHFHAQHGTTALLPTTMTGPADETLAAVEAVAAFVATQRNTTTPATTAEITAEIASGNSGARVLGVHLEGPFISPQFPGAQPAIHIRPPDVAEFERWMAAAPVRMLTLAPEQPGALDLIDTATRHRVVTVLGHTNASLAECRAAAARGLSQATHTYNAMRGLHHREPGALGAVLSDDRIDAQLIADNIHVHPAAMNILARCKGTARTLLITDAMRAAGLPPGEYTLGGQAVALHNGECRLADGTLAGSVLTMERALQNFMAATGLPLAHAWPVSSYVPARALGLHHERGRLAVGYAADLVVLDADLDVVATVVGGRVAHLRDPERLRP